MRLGQLARKLNISPTRIINFLSENNIDLPEGSNAKLDSKLEADIVSKFAERDTILESNELQANAGESIEEIEPGISIIETAPQEIPNFPPLAEESEVMEDRESSEDPETQVEEMELIKAPKVTLPGLKVVGKIDLPEHKETAEEFPDESEDVENSEIKEIQKVENTPSVDNRRQRGRNKRRSEKLHKNPVEAKREREEKEAKRQRKIQARRNKDQRRLRYLEEQQKIQVSTSKKANVIEDSEKQPEEIIEEPVVRRNWLSRLWHMLDAD